MSNVLQGETDKLVGTTAINNPNQALLPSTSTTKSKKLVFLVVSLLFIISLHIGYMFFFKSFSSNHKNKTMTATPLNESNKMHAWSFSTSHIVSFFMRYAFSEHRLNFLNFRKTIPHAHPFASDYYLDAQNSMRRLTLETLSVNVHNPEVVIVSQLFGRNREGHHYHDMLACIQINLLNPFVAEYHFLQEDTFNNEDLMNLINAKHKVKISILGKRLMSSDFMEYCNVNLKDRVVLLTNTDIYFDHTLVHASKLKFDTSLILSRKQTFITDYLEGENRDHCMGGYVGSHDVFMFRTQRPFPQDAIHKLREVPLGYYGSENVIMHHVANNNDFRFKIKNACETIFVWHLHEKRGGNSPPRINDATNTATMGPGDVINDPPPPPPPPATN